VNSLHGTNVYATTRMAKHAAAVLAAAKLAMAGPELVERLADFPATEVKSGSGDYKSGGGRPRATR
jgi:hypothetical protein